MRWCAIRLKRKSRLRLVSCVCILEKCSQGQAFSIFMCVPHLVDNLIFQVRARMLASQRGRIPLRTVINSVSQLISSLPPTCNAIISFAPSMHVCSVLSSYHYTYPVGYIFIYSIFRSHTMILALNEQYLWGRHRSIWSMKGHSRNWVPTHGNRARFHCALAGGH